MKLNFDELDFDKFEEITNRVLVINKELIDDEMSTHSISYSYYQGLHNRYRYYYERALTDFESTCSLLKNQELLRNRNSGSKATVAYLDNYIKSLPEYVEGKKKLIDVEEKVGYLQAISRAMEHRKDLLVQLSANRRSESKLYS